MLFPSLFNNFASDSVNHHILVGIFKQIDGFVRSEHPTFFPDYTKHGRDHITDVCETAWKLIARDGKKALTPEDACMLALSVLLHDCAMHLTPEGFATLVEGKGPWKHVEEFDTQDWPMLWEDFLQEVRRMDDKALKKIFGESKQVEPPKDLRRIVDEDQLRLVGEFLRRHHPRLAHEIALYGIPAKDGAHPLFDGLDEEYRGLAGRIARSHGMSLRKSFEPLVEDDHHRIYLGCHPVFLMVLLRVADYVQIQAPRAPKEQLIYKTIKSPTSQLEWRVHDCVKSIREGVAHDPELLQIDASPDDVEAYLRLRQWLEGIQEELDASWAVLGEVYGRFPPHNKLGLCFRRLRSDTDDKEKLAKRVPYIPTHAQFRAAGPELLRLLIGPLYGDEPLVGIRELMQNATDAVRQFDALAEKNPALKALPRLDLGVNEEGEPIDVLIKVEMDENDVPCRVIVQDRGVGMSPEIIENYFLKAGASFRNSDGWKKNFLDQDGKATIIRNGRFGIGALAAYLIGDKIKVSTCHYEAKGQGVEFETTLDAESISLNKWTEGAAIGTTVTVDVREGEGGMIKKVDDGLYWGGNWRYLWFFDNYPVVKIDGCDFSKNLLEKHFWTKSSFNENILYSYDSSWITYNGIAVAMSEFAICPKTVVSHVNPALKITSSDELLDIHLKRDGLASRPIFVRELEYDFQIDSICSLMANKEGLGTPLEGGQSADLMKRGILFFSKNDIIISDKYLLSKIDIDNVLLYNKYSHEINIKNNGCYLTYFSYHNLNDVYKMFNCANVVAIINDFNESDILNNLNRERFGRKLLLSDLEISELPKKSKQDWVSLIRQNKQGSLIGELFFDPDRVVKPTEFAKIWMDNAGNDFLIPWNMEERREKFSRFYDKYKSRIDFFADKGEEIKNPFEISDRLKAEAAEKAQKRTSGRKKPKKPLP